MNFAEVSILILRKDDFLGGEFGNKPKIRILSVVVVIISHEECLNYRVHNLYPSLSERPIVLANFIRIRHPERENLLSVVETKIFKS